MTDGINWYMNNKPEDVPEDTWKLLMQYAGVIGENMKLRGEITELEKQLQDVSNENAILRGEVDYWMDYTGGQS